MIKDPQGLCNAILELFYPHTVRSAKRWGDKLVYVDLARHFGKTAPYICINVVTSEVTAVNWKSDIKFHHEFGPVVDECIKLVEEWSRA